MIKVNNVNRLRIETEIWVFIGCVRATKKLLNINALQDSTAGNLASYKLRTMSL